ncbi:MAG TPA: hypothetical protein VEC57_13205 [Candidatus Limnocylindrales bacterium]|nr:hypothetical protein [Candidatus Limnocylindrales bacterium]
MAPSAKDTSEKSYDSKGKARQDHLAAGKGRSVDATGDAADPPGGGSARVSGGSKNPPTATTPVKRARKGR